MSLTSERPSPLVPGYRLDRYELLCPIAEGGMASVWVARQLGKHGFEKIVAIKTILAAHASDPQFQQMFLDEARIAWRIEHANVAQILDLGDEHGVLYLVMEWIDGDALSRLLRAVKRKNASLPLGIALRILADASGGLHAAHELRRDDGLLGVVHRDVSPQNILVSVKGVSKVIDFGIAMARDRIAAETNGGVLKGKIHYMAPEQALGQRVDRRADIWAIGAVLYLAAAGRPPFDGENQLAVLHVLTSGAPPPPLPSTVPSPVREVVMKALAFKREDRYETAADLQRALEQAMVDADLTTTVGDVAAFCHEQLWERADARKKALALGLDAAAERKRVHRLLTPSPEVTTHSTALERAAPPGVASPGPPSAASATVPLAPGLAPSLFPTAAELGRIRSAHATPSEDAVAASPPVTVPSRLPEVPAVARGPRAWWRMRALVVAVTTIAAVGLVGTVRAVVSGAPVSRSTDAPRARAALPDSGPSVSELAAVNPEPVVAVEPPVASAGRLADAEPSPVAASSATLPSRTPQLKVPAVSTAKPRRVDYGF